MKPIKEKGYEHYLISEDGKIYNTLSTSKKLLDVPKQLKSYVHKNTGYITVVLTNPIDGPKAFYVHRLVATAYIKNPLQLPQVNHKNHNKCDNSVSNLEWVTAKQNAQHAHKNKKSKKSLIYDSIVNNKDLLNDGINLYKKIGRIDTLADFWNVSVTIAGKVLNNSNVEIYKKNLIPLYIKKELIEAYKNNNHWKRRHLKKYAFDKYGITLSGHYINSIMKNQESFTAVIKSKIIEKNIIEKTVLDFCFDI